MYWVRYIETVDERLRTKELIRMHACMYACMYV